MRRLGWIWFGLVGYLSLLCLAGQVFGEDAMSGYLDRSYYTTEQEAVAVCSSGLPAKALEDRVLLVKDTKGNVLARSDVVSAETRIPLNIAALPTGKHTLKVEFQKKTGEVVFAHELILDKKPPKPGCEWKIDRINRAFLRNGEPFFPFGLLMPGSENDFAAAAQMGFNTVHTWTWRRKPEHAAQYVEWAAKHGLVTIINHEGFCRAVELDSLKDLVSAEELESAQKAVARSGYGAKKFSATLMYGPPALKKLSDDAKTRLLVEYDEKNAATLTEALNRAKDSPYLLGYHLFDEPIKLSSVLGRRMYARVQETDGYHPSFVIYSSNIPKGDEFVDWMDVLGTDPYWTPGKSGSRGNVNYVSKITYLTRKRADERRQVAWSVPMGEYWSGIRKRAIMPKEEFCQTYLAVIHGAKAITYFRWPFKCQQTTDTHTALCKEMKLVGPIAVTPDIPQVVKYNPGKFDPENDEYPDIQVSLRRNPAGGYVLLAANSRYYPVDATYRIPLLGDGAKVRRLFDAKEYKSKDGAFSDHVEFLGTRAYAFESNAPLDKPVEISVEMKAYPDRVDPVYGAPGLPDTGRPGKRNLMRNPGFEEAGLPNWPDYYLFGTQSSLDTQNPYEGKTCLKVETKGRGERVYAACSPKLEKDTPFVLSAYMRADRDGVKVRFVGFGWLVPKETFGYKDFTLTTKWQRYSEKGTLIPGLPSWHSVGVLVHGRQEATVYIDALQFEKGTELTEYEP